MTTSGTFTFNPSNGELVLSAYSRIGVRRPSILNEHMVDARNELNYMFSEWSNKQVNLWEVDLVSTVLVADQSSYAVDAKTVMILDAYITTTDASGINNDRVILPISRTEYASFPDKTTSAVPTVYWFDRVVSPTITLWQPPDDSTTYTLNYYRCVQMQDASLPSGETANIPYLWIDALVSGLSYRLARIWAPDLEDRRFADAERSWDIAATQNVENVPLYITPGVGSYYR